LVGVRVDKTSSSYRIPGTVLNGSDNDSEANTLGLLLGLGLVLWLVLGLVPSVDVVSLYV